MNYDYDELGPFQKRAHALGILPDVVEDLPGPWPKSYDGVVDALVKANFVVGDALIINARKLWKERPKSKR